MENDLAKKVHDILQRWKEEELKENIVEPSTKKIRLNKKNTDNKE